MNKVLIFNSAIYPDSEAAFKNGGGEVFVVILPGKDVKLNLDCVLASEGERLTISGLFIASAQQRVELNLDIRHEVGSCYSLQDFKGIASGSSKVKFSGRIVVAHDAQKTEAYQKNNNLLLSQTAEVSTEPQLEIYADDVKCSHGATVAQLDRNEQFYMQSRGIGLADARYLQCISFLSSVLKGLPEDLIEEVLEKVRELL